MAATAVIGLVAGVVFFGWGPTILDLLNQQRATVYGTLAAIFGSLLGFTITAVAIVLSVANFERMDVVRKSPHYAMLWNIFKSSIRWLAVAAFAALLALLFDQDDSPHIAATILVLYTGLVGIARVARTIWVLELLIGLVTTRPVEE